MHKVLMLAAAAASSAAMAALAACSPSHSNSTPHASLSTRVQCGVQMHTWEKANHFSNLLSRLTTDIRTLPSGSAAGDRTAAKQMTGVLASDVRVLQQHAAPSCVPGFSTQLNAGLAALLAADQASHSKSAASVQTASGDLHAAGTYLRTASDDVARYAATGRTTAAHAGTFINVSTVAYISRPRDPWPSQFYMLLGTGEPRTLFSPPYTAYNCRSLFYQASSLKPGVWYLACTPQLYVYVRPNPDEQLPI